MDMETRVYVLNDLDVMLARVQARQIAQKLGFSSADQARISLATSELARLLSWEAFQPGELTIANVRNNGHRGLQVWCLVPQEYVDIGQHSNGFAAPSGPYRSFLGACRLADESSLDPQDGQLVRVTLVTWLK